MLGKIPRMFLFLEYKGRISLNPDNPITIGRTPKNDIVVSSLTVSRRHATIACENNCFVIRDLNSRNGTFLNGNLITEAKLLDGDIIKIGGYQITVHAVEEAEFCDDDTLKDFESALSTTIDLRREAYALMVGNVQGDLKTLGIDEIVQIIEVNHKTGMLALNGTELKPMMGCLYFENGEIVHALYEDKKGEDAAIHLLQASEGRFEFITDKNSPFRSITKSTLWLMYEANRIRDEHTIA